MLNSDDLINKVKDYNKFLDPEKSNKIIIDKLPIFRPYRNQRKTPITKIM